MCLIKKLVSFLRGKTFFLKLAEKVTSVTKRSDISYFHIIMDIKYPEKSLKNPPFCD